MGLAQEQIGNSRIDQAVRSPQRGEQNQRQREELRRRARLLNRLSLGFCCAVCFFAVWLVAAKGASIYSMNYQNSRLQAQVAQQQADNANLSSQIAADKDPANILAKAKKLGLQKPTKTVTIPTTESGK
ncbi:septum formation initiator family protein [Alicyclobacillus acidoterrestris]|uniref:Septum formation initiator family protein n=1 Tax=Alicyclobacillus acidoterrestris (strain ATCC 49025 / DSM 3922 / CIP 106132 / NCIMB 13137 / GD3B) TaxID=1356854 RepID=T0D2B6_ALIAG|nr:septum formation initiator family protein [Alicyclobacillus acidoterrestris]EPZ43901.1 hypothetical protein N007_01070 [Alicyclobacillus acidoterrestris ATCC 49025]UNO50572.1 septum formation initiator family protein [Alicyclobacillus acidoterrestris]